MAFGVKNGTTLKGRPDDSSAGTAPLSEEQETAATNSFLVQQIRDEGASHGLLGRDRGEGWDEVAASLANPAGMIPAEDGSEQDYETGYDRELRRRLEEIKKLVEPRLAKASSDVDRLRKNHYTPYGTRIMIWIGWLCVTSLGWVFSWILSKIISNDIVGGSVLNDLVALFVRSFSDLNALIVSAFPMFDRYQWLVLLIGILSVLFSILAYLNVQKLSGDMRIFENVIGMFSQVSSRPDLTQTKYEAETARVAKRKAAWLIASIGTGLPGIGILLSSIKSDYSLSMIILGYTAAAVVVAVMMLILHMHYDSTRSDDEVKVVPGWLFSTIRNVTLSLLGILLLALFFFVNDSYIAIVQCLVVAVIGAYLLVGTCILAVGIIHSNLYKDERHWQRVMAHIDYRLRVLQGKQDNRRQENTEKKKQIQDLRQKECVRIAKYKRIYNSAYELGVAARQQGLTLESL